MCERGSAHYSKPAAKHFPGLRRRRRMALVSPCPLGDVHHPTYLKIDAQDNEKCQMWQSRILLCSRCEGMSLITFLPPTTFNPGEPPRPKVSKEVRDIYYGWTQNGKEKTFSSQCWLLNYFVAINQLMAFRIFFPTGYKCELLPHTKRPLWDTGIGGKISDQKMLFFSWSILAADWREIRNH